MSKYPQHGGDDYYDGGDDGFDGKDDDWELVEVETVGMFQGSKNALRQTLIRLTNENYEMIFIILVFVKVSLDNKVKNFLEISGELFVLAVTSMELIEQLKANKKLSLHNKLFFEDLLNLYLNVICMSGYQNI